MKKQHSTMPLALLYLMLFPLLGWAQVQVSGKVTDADTGEPLPGVAITVEGTTLGTQTDLEGNYELSVPNSQAVLVFRFLGYANQTATANRNVINIALQI